jgi:hypothetical protein
MLWKSIIDIGHTAVMFPLAAAIAAWLVIGRSWRMAAYWCGMFVAGVGLVALSKIAFLGWGAGFAPLAFKALSGHTLCASAVIPVFFYVVLQGSPAPWRSLGVAFGVSVSIVLSGLIVYFGFHSASEVVASFALGMSISLGYMRIADAGSPPRINRWTVSISAIVFAAMFTFNPSSINYQVVVVALHLSGRDYPYEWATKTICQSRRSVNR